MKLKIVVVGKTVEQLVLPFDIIKNQVLDGFTSGHDSNDEGRYKYDVDDDNELGWDNDA